MSLSLKNTEGGEREKKECAMNGAWIRMQGRGTCAEN